MRGDGLEKILCHVFLAGEHLAVSSVRELHLFDEVLGAKLSPPFLGMERKIIDAPVSVVDPGAVVPHGEESYVSEYLVLENKAFASEFEGIMNLFDVEVKFSHVLLKVQGLDGAAVLAEVKDATLTRLHLHPVESFLRDVVDTTAFAEPDVVLQILHMLLEVAEFDDGEVLGIEDVFGVGVEFSHDEVPFCPLGPLR